MPLHAFVGTCCCQSRFEEANTRQERHSEPHDQIPDVLNIDILLGDQAVDIPRIYIASTVLASNDELELGIEFPQSFLHDSGVLRDF